MVHDQLIVRAPVGHRLLGAVSILAILGGIAYTYPLIRHVATSIPYTCAAPAGLESVGLVPGDHLQFYYYLSLTPDMARGDVPWFTDPYQFSAPEPSRRRSFFFLPFSLIFLLASPLGGAAAYNLLVLLSFPATAIAVFLLGRRIGLEAIAAGAAALIVTLLPNRSCLVASGHPSGFVLFLMPLLFYFLERARDTESPVSAALAGACVVTLALNEPHFLFFLAFLLPAWVIWVAWPATAPPARERWSSHTLLAIAAAGPAVAAMVFLRRRSELPWSFGGLAALLTATFGLLVASWRLTAEARRLAGKPAYRQEAASYLPLAVFALYGVQPLLDLPYLGRVVASIVASALLVLKLPVVRALAVISRERRTAAMDTLGTFWPFGLALGAAALMAIQLKLATIDVSQAAAGRPLREISLYSPGLSDFLRRSWPSGVRIYPGLTVLALSLVGLRVRAAHAFALVACLFLLLSFGVRAPDWLPLYATAFHLVPFFSMIRQPAKFFGVAAAGLALVAAFGAQHLRHRLGPRFGTAVVTLAMAAIAADFSNALPFGVSLLEKQNRVYERVAQSGRGQNMLALPIWPGDSAFSSIYQYWATVTKVPIVNGYSPLTPRHYVRDVARPLASLNVGEMSEEHHQLLRAMRVGFVVLHGDAFPPKVSAFNYRFTLAAMRANPNLRFATADEGVYLFEPAAGPYRPWDPGVGWPIGFFQEAESLTLGAGRRSREPRASGGFTVSGSGSELPLVFGPYRPFPAGRYEARFRARGRGRVEVASDFGRQLLTTTRADGEVFDEIPLEFELLASQRLEFRAWGDAPAGLDVDWVLARKLDRQPEPPHRFEVEDLNALGGQEVEGDGASAGAFARFWQPEGTVVREGPFLPYEPGRLRVALRSRGAAFRLRVESADGLKTYFGSRVPASGSWAVTGGEFALPRREVLCARIVAGGEAAEVDFVEIAPAN